MQLIPKDGPDVEMVMGKALWGGESVTTRPNEMRI